MRRKKLQLLRCDRCGLTIYAQVHKETAGNRCGATVPAEFHQGILLTMTCYGTLVNMGVLV